MGYGMASALGAPAAAAGFHPGPGDAPCGRWRRRPLSLKEATLLLGGGRSMADGSWSNGGGLCVMCRLPGAGLGSCWSPFGQISPVKGSCRSAGGRATGQESLVDGQWCIVTGGRSLVHVVSCQVSRQRSNGQRPKVEMVHGQRVDLLDAEVEDPAELLVPYAKAVHTRIVAHVLEGAAPPPVSESLPVCLGASTGDESSPAPEPLPVS